jgi:hypothetical protein
MEIVLINGMSRPISDTNEPYVPTSINVDETPLDIAELKKELEDKIYTTLCQERMQRSKNIEIFRKRIDRIEATVNRLDGEIRTLNSRVLDVQGAVQRGKIVL